ncbi:NAD(P)H-dependent oxidoreductase [Rhizobium leguminosarum]|uniref:NAD(P)H-dependent oxidoreductase n=1 Tax=Rhizobium leguminosarum TaxID=384 RepID=UPI001C95ADF9|nr:NAD(P)H-dependent oxidoreductase [Rhizobium leguminosarum]MBY5400993.1 NADPH-dependent FMN reductase [Rhizobium leguminosarum]
MKIVGVTGNLTRPSKTRSLCEYLVDQLSEGGSSEHCFDLIDALPGLGGTIWRSEAPGEVEALLAAVEQADILVVGFPVYKASYTGMFKHLFDLVDAKALASKPVIAFATGKAPAHGENVEAHMRSLFGFFEARMPARFIYALDQDFEAGLPGSSLKAVVHQVVQQVRTDLVA